MNVFVFQKGDFWETAKEIKVFSSLEKAIKVIPKGFREQNIGGYNYYVHNDHTREWIGIKEYEIL